VSQSEWFTSYLEYSTLEDMLKVILYTSQSMFAIVPMLYYISDDNSRRHIIFIQTGIVGGVVVHYFVAERKPANKFIELNKLTGKFSFVDSIGSEAQAIYIPILGLKRSTLHFPN
jgi:hypothetical protein